MARVQLITTGAMEERALGKSLRGFFPDHEFVSRPHLDGFTSARLPPTPPLSRVPLNLDKLAATLIGVFDPGNRRDRPRPDFVVVVEDVELANADDPARITAALRETLSRKLESWPANAGTLDRLREELQSKASFHLMAPMTEAYFFADTAATARPSTVSVPSRDSTGPTSRGAPTIPASRGLCSPTCRTCSALRWPTGKRTRSPGLHRVVPCFATCRAPA